MRSLSYFLLILAGCVQALPELPEEDSGPTQIQILGLSHAETEEPLDAAAIYVGTPILANIELLTNSGPALGSGLRVSIQQQGFLELFRFPQGDACTTDSSGRCQVLLVSTGIAGELKLRARSTARPDLLAEQSLTLIADDRRLSLRFDLGAAGLVDWEEGRADPLPNAPPFSVIANGDPTPLKIQVLGQQGNPIVGVDIRVTIPPLEADETAAVRLHSSADGSCGELLEARSHTVTTGGDEGWALACLSGGARTGRWTLSLAVPGRIGAEQVPGSADGSFFVQGSTRSAEPASIRALDASEEEPEPTSRCEPGLVSAPMGFEVLDEDGLGVSGVAVIMRSDQLDLVGSPIHITNAEGQFRVLVQCPVSLPAPAALQASLVDQPGLQARVWVALWAQPVHQLIPRAGEAGAELGRIQPGQPFSVIIEARDRQASLVPDTRIDLQLLRWSGASELRLSDGEDCNPEAPLLPAFMITDARPEVDAAPNPDYGSLRLDLCAYGPATVARPMSLVAKVHGQDLRREIPLLLAPGPAATVSFEPAEGIAVLLGGAFGPLSVQVRDGAGNGVAGAAVSLDVPDSLLISPSGGFTNAMGSFNFLITSAELQGEVELLAQAQQGEDFQQEARLNVAVGPGTPQRIRLMRNGRTLLEQAGATTLQVPIGQRLEDPVLLRLENEVGGGLGGLGLSVSPGADNPDGCGQIGPEGLITDDDGEVMLGGDDGVVIAAGPVITSGEEAHCHFDLEHGQVRQRLRILQVAGPPSGGSLIALAGDGPEQFLASQGPPAEFTAENSQAVQLIVTDALGNPKAGLRVWLNVSNCWLNQRIQHLDGAGQATWRVAGGRDHSRPCILQAVTGETWPQAPSLSTPLDGYPLPRLNGLRQTEPYNNSYRVLNSTFFRLEGAETVTRFLLDLGANYTPFRPAVFDGQAGDCFRQDLADQGGDPYQGCTKAELWTVDLGEDRQVDRAKLKDLPIEAAVEAGGFTYFLSLQHGDLGEGRELEVRLVEPDGGAGAPVPLYAHPPIDWLELTPDYLSIPVLPGADGEALKILGGQRHQLDDDPFLEAVLCGLDDLGGWVQVMDQEGEDYRFYGHRSWLHGPEPRSPYTPQIGRLACPLADLDNDGHLDLAQPTGTHANNLLPRIAFLPGTGAAPFFGEPVESILLAGQDKPLIQLDITGPPFTLWFGDSNVHGQAGDCSRRNTTRCGSIDIQHSPFAGDPNTVLAQASLADEGRQFQRAAFDTARVPGIGGITTSAYWTNPRYYYVTAVYPFATAPKRAFRVPVEASGSIQLWSLSGDGLTLALMISDNTVRFIDRFSRKLLRTVLRPDDAHGRRSFTADHQTVVSSNDEEVIVWDLNTGLVLARIPGFHPAIDPEGRWLAVQTGQDRNPTIRLYDLQAPEAPVASWDSQVDLPVLAIQPGGERIAVTGCSNGSNCKIFLFDQELTLLRQWPAGCFWRGGFGGHLTFTPEGDGLLCMTESGGHLYDLDGERLWYRGGRGRPATAGISAQGNHVMWHRDWGHCELGRMRDGFILQGVATWANCAAPFFSADGKWAASYQAGGLVGVGVNLWPNLTWGEGTLEPVLDQYSASRYESGWQTVVTEKLLGQGSAVDGVLVYYRQQDLRVRKLRTWRPHCGNGRLDPGETVDEGQPWEGTGRDIHCGAD